MAYLGRQFEVGNRIDAIIKARAMDQAAGYGKMNIISGFSYVTKLYCWLVGIEPNLTSLLEPYQSY